MRLIYNSKGQLIDSRSYAEDVERERRYRGERDGQKPQEQAMSPEPQDSRSNRLYTGLYL